MKELENRESNNNKDDIAQQATDYRKALMREPKGLLFMWHVQGVDISCPFIPSVL